MANQLKKTMRIAPPTAAMLAGGPSALREIPSVDEAASAGEEESHESVLHYYVFADDRQVYGPATVSLLQEWAAQGLVSNKTWVYEEGSNTWRKAQQIKEIREILPASVTVKETGSSDVTPAQLRRIRLFSDMDDHQIEEFLASLTKVTVAAFKPVVRKGEHGNSMYLLLMGEAIITTRVNGVEKTMANLRPGDFFGESSIVDEGPRPFNVNSTADCTFLRFKHSDFQEMQRKHPDLTARFLTALVRHMSFLILDTNNRFAQAKAMVRGSLAQTGQITMPPGHAKR